MNDMAATIIPKSDQLNADDLIAGSITIKVSDVSIRSGQEQPISIHYEGDGGKPYKACKSMCRVMVTAWGADSKAYIGRSMTLYRDPSVKWGGMEVGGIRISHMSDIDSKITLALTMTRANKKPFTVRPLEASGTKTAATQVAQMDRASGKSADAEDTEGRGFESRPAPAAAPCITAEEALILEARCTDNGINVAALKKAAGVDRLSLIAPADLARCHQWVDKAIERRGGA